MSTNKYTAIFSDGTSCVKKSSRPYTHAWALIKNGVIVKIGFSTREQYAVADGKAEAKFWTKYAKNGEQYTYETVTTKIIS